MESSEVVDGPRGERGSAARPAASTAARGRAKVVFIGSNRGLPAGSSGPGLSELQAAEHDAQTLSNLFEDLGYLRSPEPGTDSAAGADNVLLRSAGAGRDNVRRVLAEVSEVETGLLLVYWSGHLHADRGNQFYFVPADAEDDLPDSLVALSEVVHAVRRAKAAQRVLIVDTCFAGRANAQAIHEGAQAEGVIVLAAAAGDKMAYEGEHGFLTEQLLEALRQAQRRAEADFELDLYDTLQRAADRLREGHDQVAWLSQVAGGGSRPSLTVHFQPARASASRPEPLEQALGYATQALRSYLREKIVTGVEVVYFLGYDVWDGCLVYEGLVEGSIEQKLLNYVRQTFLRRDRLRSKYEEHIAEKRVDKLGPAGHCFHEALEILDEEPGERGLLDAVRYVGDLANYEFSEYGGYDDLLGLGCCLYIPVVGSLLGPQGGDGGPRRSAGIPVARQPRGGVLMAACRQPYGLRPILQGEPSTLAPQLLDELDKAVEAPPKEKTATDLDERISQALAHLLAASDEPGGDSSRHAEIAPYLGCIGSVYLQRARTRLRIRQGFHPSFAKSTARAIERALEWELTGKVAAPDSEAERKRKKALSDAARDNVRALRRQAEKKVESGEGGERSARAALHLGNEVRRGLTFSQDDLNKDPQADLASWNHFLLRYGIGCVWRDLSLAQRSCERQLSEARSKPARDDKVVAAAEDLLAKVRHELDEGSWSQQESSTWAARMAEAQEFRVLPLPRHAEDLSQGRVLRWSRDLLMDLIDTLRDARRPPLEIVREALCMLGPVERYVGELGQDDRVLQVSTGDVLFYDLAHTLQVWALGLWILKLPIENGSRGATHVDEAVCGEIRSHFKNTLKGEQVADEGSRQKLWSFERSLESLWGDDDRRERLALFWGLLAAVHDIARPVQRFGLHCIEFFKRYFGEPATKGIDRNKPLAVLDLLNHPSFPIYKNAITGLYTTRKRDWLEVMFYHAVAKRVEHDMVSSLILISELDPEARPAPWRAERAGARSTLLWHHARERLRRLHEMVKEVRPELGFAVPAYLGHAIAFSHLPDLENRWAEIIDHREIGEGHGYLKETAARFQLEPREYPLTFLLALVETLTEPRDDTVPLVGVEIPPEASDVQRPESSSLGWSPFYVKEVTAHEASREAGDRHPAKKVKELRITLNLWADSLEAERQTISPPDFKSLCERYEELRGRMERNEPRERWLVFSEAGFQLRLDRQKADRAKKRDVRLDVVPNSPAPVYASLSENRVAKEVWLPLWTYEVLRMWVRLRAFDQRFYDDSWSYVVKFENVRDEKGEHLRYCGGTENQTLAAGIPGGS